jgi:acetylornithine deacetylase
MRCRASTSFERSWTKSPLFDTREIQKLLERLVGIESVNPTLVSGGAGEAELARFVADWLERNGVVSEYHDLGDSRANVVGRVVGRGGGRSLMLNAHLDTVGLASPDAGLQTRVDGNRVYGRGAFDMKGSLAAIMLVAAAVAESPLAGDVILTAVADEEANSIGTEAVAKSIGADAAIVVEPTWMQLAIAHRGFAWFEIETEGVAAHGARYDIGVDAITKMGSILVALADFEKRLSANGEQHPLLGRASAHASLVHGGTDLATYPDRCVVKVERRTLPGETAADIENEMKELANGATVRTLVARQPLEVSETEPIVTTLLEEATRVMGRPEIVGVPFWTDAALLADAGIPTVVFGPGGEGLHTDAEWVDVDDLVKVATIVEATARSFCRSA